MAQEVLFRDIQLTSDEIEIRKIKPKDLWESLKKGFDDFNAHPTVVLFLFVFYPLLALLLTLLLTGQNPVHLAIPIVSGFTFIGPIVLVCLYEMSRYRERGIDVTIKSGFDFVHSSSYATILALSIVMMLLYLAWLYIAQLLYFGRFGENAPATLADFITQVLTTRNGNGFLFYGIALGFMFAVVALSISVVSFPLALDKPVSSITAITTSIKAVMLNPLVMALWGLIVTILLIAGTALLLVGLVAVVPILGHATWHLYRKLIKF